MNDVTQFQRIVRTYYRQHGRYDLPWRRPEPNGTFDPYKILVSEIMLQQTQVGRVIPKFHAFVEQFPNVEALARAPLGDVLRAWSGLGYNRRAKYLQQTARLAVQDFDGVIPCEVSQLTTLPGIGINTAGAIRAYAFDRATVFIETNIRTVYLYHFFAGEDAVADRLVRDKVAATLPKTDVRVWYWALMDYGAHLKQTIGNLNHASRSYVKQSAFSGSNRQLRGQVIRLLGERAYSAGELMGIIDDERLPGILERLLHEALIAQSNELYHL